MGTCEVCFVFVSASRSRVESLGIDDNLNTTTNYGVHVDRQWHMSMAIGLGNPCSWALIVPSRRRTDADAGQRPALHARLHPDLYIPVLKIQLPCSFVASVTVDQSSSQRPHLAGGRSVRLSISAVSEQRRSRIHHQEGQEEEYKRT